MNNTDYLIKNFKLIIEIINQQLNYSYLLIILKSLDF